MSVHKSILSFGPIC